MRSQYQEIHRRFEYKLGAARHGGLRVLGLSGISNAANLDGNTVTTHEEVLAAGQTLVPKLAALVRGVLQRLPPGKPIALLLLPTARRLSRNGWPTGPGLAAGGWFFAPRHLEPGR